MPQRSNDFQYLVGLIHHLYAPRGARVTPSAIVTPQSGGPAREVDVLVEYETELYPVKIAVEARDRSRPLDVTGIEQYIGKYNSSGGIVVDKVIIVARSFTELARERARLLGFNVHTVTELEQGNLDPFFSRPGNRGCWWVSRTLGKEVDVRLLAKQGKPLPLQSMITAKRSKTRLGTALMWAQRALEHHVGRIADEQYERYQGQFVHVVVELVFRDYKAHIHSKSYTLDKLIFDFGNKMRIPPTKAEKYNLTGDSGEPKTVVRETGIGDDAKVCIIYEEKKQASRPSRLYLDHQSSSGGRPKAKKVVIKVEV